MGTMPTFQPRLFFDVETMPDPVAAETLPMPEAPGNYKDEAKIAEYVAQKRARQVEKAALDPDTGIIAAIGTQLNGTNHTRTHFDASEGEMLEKFWALFATCNGHTVGYNTLRFDFPFVMRRSMAIGIRLPKTLIPDLRRYQVEPTTDLMAIMYGNPEDLKKLSWLTKRYNLDHDPQLDAVDHAKIADLDEATLRAVVEDDVRRTVSLYEKMNGMYFHHG